MAAQEGLREALTSTGNGYFCTRGCAEWEDADGTHYPGTHAHGIYNRRTTVMGSHPVPNEDLVNLPNWLVLKLRIEGDEPFRLADVELLAYRHAYDFRNAVVIRELRFRDVFAADLSGRDFARGKPDPEIFLAAGEALHLAPSECFVVEDAGARASRPPCQAAWRRSEWRGRTRPSS